MIPIKYLIGDATLPQGPERHKFLIHVCNDQGGWGAGFVLALSRRYPCAEQEYRRWYREFKVGLKSTFELGAVQAIYHYGPTLTIGNMVAQVLGDPSGVNIRYDALDKCLNTVYQMSQGHLALLGSTSIHMPRIGCGLAGGTWDRVEPMIIKNFSNRGVPVYVYDLK